MISPDTRPGTDVICIDDSPGRYGACALTRGGIYTVDRIGKGLHDQFIAILAGVQPKISYEQPWGKVIVGFALRRFRYIEISKELTELLAQPRVRIPEEVE